MRRRRWAGLEIQMLADRYREEGPFQLALELGRTEDSVSSFARRCGLRTERQPYRQRATLPDPVSTKIADS